MSNSFTNQTLAQLDLWQNDYKVDVYRLPKKLDEEVAAEMVAGFGGVITKLNKAQATYIGVPPEGPFKPDSYKY
jgi:adenosylhomocysteinase